MFNKFLSCIPAFANQLSHVVSVLIDKRHVRYKYNGDEILYAVNGGVLHKGGSMREWTHNFYPFLH